MLSFGRSPGMIEEMVQELYESLGDVAPEDFEAKIHTMTPAHWISYLDQNNALIIDFLSRTPKQRLAKLLSKHKENWLDIHVLAFFAVKRSLMVLKVLESFPSDGAHYRDILRYALKLDSDLRANLKNIDLSTGY